MKRILSFLLVLVFLIAPIASAFTAVPVSADEFVEKVPTRVINVVYDDSGSMIRYTDDATGKKVLVDTWCKAKYAMEVFAAMLGEKDTMKVFAMSQFDTKNKKRTGKPELILSGSDGSHTNVAKIHNMTTAAYNTPFLSVEKAYEDLLLTSADEKWLVVLTDGEFDVVDELNPPNPDAFFGQKDSKIKVLFLGMGDSAGSITEVPSKDIYFEKASTNNEILTKVTDMCSRIFNRDRLDVDVSSKTIEFDVPLKELIIFAQGANVQIHGIKRSDGTLIQSSTTPVTVKYSTKATSRTEIYDQCIYDDKLLGSLATFKDDFVAGSYTLDVTGAETIEVYYKPNIQVKAYLKDANGNYVEDNSYIEEGEYTVEFGLVKSGTDEKVPESKLLGEVKYRATVTNNGTTHDKEYESGSKVYMEEGKFIIDVIASYLRYNTVSTSLEYTIVKNKKITFSILDNPEYKMDNDGFVDTDPIKMKALLDGREYTADEWEQMGIPNIGYTSTPGFNIDELQIEKSDEIGVFYIHPSLGKQKPSNRTYSDCEYTVSYSSPHNNEIWSGDTAGTLKIKDTRPWYIRNLELFRWLCLLALLLFLIFIYAIKARLPKNLKKRPYIEASPKIPGNDVEEYRGEYRKDMISVILPIVPETGTIRFVPTGCFGVAKMKVEAIRGRRMKVKNIKSYTGKDHIMFNGSPVAEGQKELRLSAGTSIVVENPEWTYTCQLNS